MKQTHFPRIPARFLEYLLLLTMLTAGVSFSRYKTTLTATGSVKVARPVVEYVPAPDEAMLNGKSVVWSSTTISNLKPGDELHYPIDVRNYNNANQVSEVKMFYTLSASIATANGASVQQYDTSWTDNNNSGTLPSGSDQKQNRHTLVITWDASMNDAAYMNKEQLVSITLIAEQVN